MPAFNAEAEIKNVDRRLDKLEASVTQLEKSVKLLIDTRGDSKADALKKLELLVREQAKEIDAVPEAQMKALDAAVKKNAEQFQKLLEADRKATLAEYDKTQELLQKEIVARHEALKREQTDASNRIEKLQTQADAAFRKRDEAIARQHKELMDKFTEQIKAQTEAAKDAALLEARFLKLEALVMAALAKK